MKKLLSTCILFAIIFSLTGCAPKTNNSVSDKNTATSPTPTPIYKAFTLYYPSSETKTLFKETQELKISDTQSNEEIVLNALFKGPKGDDSVLYFNDDAKIHSIKTISGLCTVDFTNNIFPVELVDKNDYILLIQAIVHSLCALNNVQEVKININGNTAYHIDASIDLSQPVLPDESYLKTTE